MANARRELISALDLLCSAIERNAEADRVILVRAREVRDRLLQGDRLDDIVHEPGRPLIVRLTRENIERLYDAGSVMRRAEARALHDEGMSMDRIAALFGVTRQRVSALLRSQAGGAGSGVASSTSESSELRTTPQSDPTTIAEPTISARVNDSPKNTHAPIATSGGSASSNGEDCEVLT